MVRWLTPARRSRSAMSSLGDRRGLNGPLRNLPQESDCAGGAGARNAESTFSKRVLRQAPRLAGSEPPVCGRPPRRGPIDWASRRGARQTLAASAEAAMNGAGSVEPPGGFAARCSRIRPGHGAVESEKTLDGNSSEERGRLDCREDREDRSSRPAHSLATQPTRDRRSSQATSRGSARRAGGLIPTSCEASRRPGLPG